MRGPEFGMESPEVEDPVEAAQATFVDAWHKLAELQGVPPSQVLEQWLAGAKDLETPEMQERMDAGRQKFLEQIGNDQTTP